MKVLWKICLLGINSWIIMCFILTQSYVFACDFIKSEVNPQKPYSSIQPLIYQNMFVSWPKNYEQTYGPGYTGGFFYKIELLNVLYKKFKYTIACRKNRFQDKIVDLLQNAIDNFK